MSIRGTFENMPPAKLFADLAESKKSGVLYFKGTGGEQVFVIVKRGKAVHASGDLGDGDMAIVGLYSFSEAAFNFIEDIVTDSETFVDNLSDEIIATLVQGEADSYNDIISSLSGDNRTPQSESPSTELIAEKPKVADPPPANETKPGILFFADKANELCFDNGMDLDTFSVKAKDASFTGIAAGISDQQIGYGIYIDGNFIGEAAIDNKGLTSRVRAGAQAFSDASRIEAYIYDKKALYAYMPLVKGTEVINKISAKAINIDEFILWAEETKLSCFVWINDKRRTANILISKGEVIGAMTDISASFSKEIDDALAIFYSPDAMVEIFSTE